MGSGLHVLYKDTALTIMVEVGDEKVSLEKSQEIASIIFKKLK